MIKKLLLLALPALASAQLHEPLILPENPRIMAMGGAFVGLADDPQAAIWNPAGIRALSKIGYDISLDAATIGNPDHVATTLVNPQSEAGSSFGIAAWSQGFMDKRKIRYFVPETSTNLKITTSTFLGMAVRLPYVHSSADSVESRWETAVDLCALQVLGRFRIGAMVERAIGGGEDIVPRQLHAGASFSSSGIIISHEWRGFESDKKYDFHRASSHWGMEAEIGKYGALRGGYIAGIQHRVTFGVAFGLIKSGWRLETGWDLPAGAAGDTRWSAGMGYRI